MSAKYTPGPWEVWTNDHNVDEPPFRIDTVGSNGNNDEVIGFAYTESDARLIAEAPAMAEALRRWAHAMEQGRYPELQGVASETFAILTRIEGSQ